ncbi:hypothetical protein C943_00975 [Mariniradius saccharolyticus AK6]|uniref:Uncharacterized protein n=1 Tax=Mariniradius saccharolyticus AK6 TaxID=1239962 RepID=M7XVU6_9BACT|nr:hypothetical protein C943_00975 [Mariniradius saccharolyticus AK6]
MFPSLWNEGFQKHKTDMLKTYCQKIGAALMQLAVKLQKSCPTSSTI